MFWKRSTGDGAFAGMIAGTLGAAVHHALTLPQGAAVGIKGGWLGIVHLYRSEMAQNFWTAIFAWTVCLLVTVLVSLCTKPPDARDLIGLVYSLTARPEEDRGSWFQRPAAVGVAVLAAAAVLNLIFR
jgi:SSS family solute:Na+ symporter